MRSAFRLAATKYGSDPDRLDGVLVRRLARAVAFDEERPAIVAIPMYVAEQVLPRYLRTMEPRLANVCLLVNAASEVPPEAFDEAYEKHRAVVEEYNRGAGRRVVSIHGVHLSGTTNMGRVRRLLCDALVERALGRSDDEPIVICNDVDQLASSQSYVGDLVDCLSGDGIRPCGAAGPVGYGYVGETAFGLPPGMVAPELYLFNRIHESIYGWARTGRGPIARVWPEGANLAFSLQAYCEAGGFDAAFATGEDDAFGRALDDLALHDQRWRPTTFLESAWVATDPRRVLSAILSGHAGLEAWAFQRFATTTGASLDAAALAVQCEQGSRFLTRQLLAGFDVRRRDHVWERVTGRIGWLFFRSVFCDCRPRTHADVEKIATAAGIALVDGLFDRGRRRFEATVDWAQSPILERLTALTRAA
jgi:hypothetical protein